MSYWIYLKNDKGEVATVDAHQEGGTYVMGGTPEAELNVTYNYSKIFSINEHLNGKIAEETLPLLAQKVAEYGTERDDDYWKPTEGNVGYMLNILHGWAEQHPAYHWEVH